ncbi:MAG: hypothetical protein U5K43_15725 [Halofilum sp. (in: g-proteobacteria)]|nr:hypothetical protein [Halofilum sp. (in: g-proteobacteria)]
MLNDLPDGLRVDPSVPAIVTGGGMSFDAYDATLDGGETNGEPGTPGNHPRILLNGTLEFGESTTVTFQAIMNDALDTTSDPFTDPETVSNGLDPEPIATAVNIVSVEFSDTAGCTEVSPPPATDSAELDFQTPDIDFDPGHAVAGHRRRRPDRDVHLHPAQRGRQRLDRRAGRVPPRHDRRRLERGERRRRDRGTAAAAAPAPRSPATRTRSARCAAVIRRRSRSRPPPTTTAAR